MMGEPPLLQDARELNTPGLILILRAFRNGENGLNFAVLKLLQVAKDDGFAQLR